MDRTKPDLSQVQESPLKVALAHLHALAQRGQHRCDLNYLGQHIPRQGIELSSTSTEVVGQCGEEMSSWVPGRAVHQVQLISLDDAQDDAEESRETKESVW